MPPIIPPMYGTKFVSAATIPKVRAKWMLRPQRQTATTTPKPALISVARQVVRILCVTWAEDFAGRRRLGLCPGEKAN